MEEIIEILMRRDGISEKDAMAVYFDCQSEIRAAIDMGCVYEVEEILRCELGLEPDYIFNFI